MDHRNSNAAFPVTRWSIVAQLRSEDHEGHRALEELCCTYRSPLYSFARHSGHNTADAEDLVQGFLSKAATNGLFEKADVDRGRLRTFLLTAFRRFARDEWEKANAQKRGSGATLSVDIGELETWYETEDASLDSPESAFDRRWAISVLENTINNLGETWRKKGKMDEFELLRPSLTQSGTSTDYEQIGQKTGASPQAVKVKIHRLRAKFATLLREEVANTIASEDDVDDELRYLIELI